MKRKQLITIIIMLAVIAGLSVGYVIMKNYNDKKSEEEQAKEDTENATMPIYDIKSDDIVKISLTNEHTSLNMIKDNDNWVQEDTKIPLNADKVNDMTSAVSSVAAIKIILQDADNLSEYELNKPLVSYTITTSDGNEYNIRLGSKVATEEDSYYALLDSDTTVYTVSSNYFSPFDLSLNDMIKIVDEVNISSDNITQFEVSRDDGFEFASEYLGDNNAENNYYTWKIEKPYKNVLADTDKLKEQLAKIDSLEYSSCIAYEASDFTEYGLDKPYAAVAIDYYNVTGTDEDSGDAESAQSDTDQTTSSSPTATPVPEEDRVYNSYKLYIGKQFDDGEKSFYYVRQDGSNNVYAMDADMADDLVKFDTFSMADPCIYSVLIDQLKSYDIEFEGKKHTIECKEEPKAEDDKTEDKDGDGKINSYYLDGKKVDESSLLTLYSAAYLLTLSGEADNSKLQGNAEAVLTITYHPKDGEDVVVKYIPYDGNNFYQVDKDGMNYFLTDKRGIDDLISRYNKFLSDNGL